MENVLEAIDIHRSFQVGSHIVHALSGVSMTCPKGRLIIIRGRSGSGKTTLLNIIGGLDRPDTGEIRVNGLSLQRFPETELTRWRRQEVGFVFQSFALMPLMTALENIELSQRFGGASWRVRQERARECLHMVGLSKRAGHRALELSGGEQQRVAIARAIANRPSLILADEPTGELDFETGMRVMELFREIVDRDGVTVVISTHDIAAFEFGDIRLVIKDGKVVSEI